MYFILGSKDVQRTACPFNRGHYKFTYTKHQDFPLPSLRCPTHTSILSNCPDDSKFSLQFYECNFDHQNETIYECLGDWPQKRDSSDKFLALRTFQGEDETPLYRCALFREDEEQIFLSLSAASTCYSDLNSASFGFETLEMRPKNLESTEKKSHEKAGFRFCSFPGWTQGEWEEGLSFNVIDSKLSSMTSNAESGAVMTKAV